MNLDDTQLTHLAAAIDLPDLSATPHYQLRGEIGRGGMGVVYRAFDTRLDREVALKVTEAAEAAEEARIAAGLEHPCIVPVYDAGALPDGRGFYVMRLMAGEPLHRYLALHPALTLSARLAIFLKLCEAAGFAHSRGVAHRDLKPSNVMVGAFGEVAVLDWGVARRYEASAEPAADLVALGSLLADLLPEPAPRPLRAIAAMAACQGYPTAAALAADVGRFQDGLAVEAYRESPLERAARFLQRNRTLLLLVGAYFGARIFVFIYWGR